MADDIKNDINDRIRRRHGGGRIWVPLGLVVVGGLLLLRQMGIGLPDWIFSWQILLIVIGIFSGLAHAFRGPGWLIMILIGTFFLMDQLIPGSQYSSFYLAGCYYCGRTYYADPPEKAILDGTSTGTNRWNQRDWERWQRRRQRRGYPGFMNMPPNPGSRN